MTFKEWCCDCGLSEGDACTDLALALAHDEHAPEDGMFEDYFSYLSGIIPEKSRGSFLELFQHLWRHYLASTKIGQWYEVKTDISIRLGYIDRLADLTTDKCKEIFEEVGLYDNRLMGTGTCIFKVFAANQQDAEHMVQCIYDQTANEKEYPLAQLTGISDVLTVSVNKA